MGRKVLLVGGVSTGYVPISVNGNCWYPLATMFWDSNATSFTTTTRVQITFRAAGTISNLRCYCSSNPGDSDISYYSNVNGSQANQTITIPTGSTGAYEDTTHTDSLSAGDEVCVECNRDVLALNGVLVTVLSMLYEASSNTICRLAAFNPTTTTAGTYYFTPGGRYDASNTTEAKAEVYVGAAATAKNLFVNCYTNTRTASTVYTFRDNGADGNQTISIPATTTGMYEDTSNTDTLSDTHVFCVKVVTSGTGGITNSACAVDIETTTGKFMFAKAYPSGGFSQTDNTTRFYGLSGGFVSPRTSAAVCNAKMGIAGSLTRLSVYVTSNASNQNSTVDTYIGSSGGNNTVTISGLGTGRYTDTTHSDTVASTDLVCLRCVMVSDPTGANNIVFTTMSLWCENTEADANLSKSLSDTATVADTLSGLLPYLVKSLSDTATTADSLAKLLLISKALSDAVSVLDSVDKAIVEGFLSKALLDSGVVSDTVSVLIPFLVRNSSDTATVSDSLGAYLGLGRNLSDTATASDALTALLLLLKSLSDTATVSDSVIGSLGIGRSLSDTVTVSDSVLKALGLERSLMETVFTSDSVSPLLPFLVRSLLETVTVSDTATPELLTAGTLVRNILDAVSVSDAATGYLGLAKLLSDTATVSDLVTVLLGLGTLVTENVSVVDQASGVYLGLLRSLTEAVSVSDLASVSIPIVVSLSDTVSVSDSVVTSFTVLDLLKALVDSVSVSDSVGVYVGLSQALADAVNVSDVVSAIVPYLLSSLTDGVTVSDSVSGGLNPLLKDLVDQLVVSDSKVVYIWIPTGPVVWRFNVFTGTLDMV